MKLARITIGGKSLEHGATVYRLRSGGRGTGRILHEHRARGNQQARDAAIWDCRDAADRLGYTIQNFSIVGRESVE